MLLRTKPDPLLFFERWLNYCVDKQYIYRFDDRLDSYFKSGKVYVSSFYGRICATVSVLIGLWFGKVGVAFRKFGLPFVPLNYSCYEYSEFGDIRSGVLFPNEAEFYSEVPIPVEFIDHIVYAPMIKQELYENLKKISHTYGVDLLPMRYDDEQVVFQFVANLLVDTSIRVDKAGEDYIKGLALYSSMKAWSERFGLDFCINYKPKIFPLDMDIFLRELKMLHNWCTRFDISYQTRKAAEAMYISQVPIYFETKFDIMEIIHKKFGSESKLVDTISMVGLV